MNGHACEILENYLAKILVHCFVQSKHIKKTMKFLKGVLLLKENLAVFLILICLAYYNFLIVNSNLPLWVLCKCQHLINLDIFFNFKYEVKFSISNSK